MFVLLALVIAGVVLLCCVGPLALCAFGGVLSAAESDPTVTITKCDVKDGGLLRNADVEYTIKNNTRSSSSYSIRFDVLDSSGTKVGDGTDYISDVGGGQTARGGTMLILDAPGGVKCEVGEVS
ncbi:FxLYD domain-containing protein [Micromonospora chersina]|uniref:FxLYD domain-containing protein n=1 Tax=Micromonospora chersina TaxID=47854 RepID=UPI0037114B43